jgi:hypothetical protein
VPNAILGIALPEGREGRVSAEVTDVTDHTPSLSGMRSQGILVVKRDGAKRS